MERLTQRYGAERMKTIRASRVDYYNQLDSELWHDQLGSLGLGGDNSVFINLAALAGPLGKPDSRNKSKDSDFCSQNPMRQVNYLAPVAAAKACEELGFGHWIQSSTQATKAERAGQVPYSRWKAMADFNLKTMNELPVTIVTLGLLYCKYDKVAGQSAHAVNMTDLALLPFTPIMGNGKAPLQPLELNDAAERLAFLALTEAEDRPMLTSPCLTPEFRKHKISDDRMEKIRVYDGVGPEIMTITQLLEKFARHNGTTFRPVHVGYRSLERIMNIASLGNLNRQFISLLRSEQATDQPILGNSEVFESLLGQDARLLTIDQGLLTNNKRIEVGDKVHYSMDPRQFPYGTVAKWIAKNPGVILPSMGLAGEMGQALMKDKLFPKSISSKEEQTVQQDMDTAFQSR